MPIIGNFGGGGGNVTSDGKTHLRLEDVFGPMGALSYCHHCAVSDE